MLYDRKALKNKKYGPVLKWVQGRGGGVNPLDVTKIIFARVSIKIFDIFTDIFIQVFFI